MMQPLFDSDQVAAAAAVVVVVVVVVVVLVVVCLFPAQSYKHYK